jgi:hypothetical protein
MTTPISALSAYATGAQFVLHTDIRAIADCLNDDGTRAGGFQPTPATVESHPAVLDALSKASGMVEMAAFVGEKYSAADLQALASNGQALLVGLVCDLATWRLQQRRWPTMAITEQYRAAQEVLERLRLGERIFALQANAAAGLPNTTFINQQSICQLFLSTTQARRFYGVRNKEYKGLNGGCSFGCGCH